MSLIVRVDRFGSRPSIAKTRSFEWTIGEDALGLLTFFDPKTEWFNFEISSQGYDVKACVPNAKYNATDLAVGEFRGVSSGDTLQYDDYYFRCFLTNAIAEAYCDNTCISASAISSGLRSKPVAVSYSLLSISKSFPLLPGACLRIGSDERDSIHLPIAGVEKEHCAVSLTGNELIVSPRNGAVSANGIVVKGNQKVARSSQIRIEPLGLPITIE